MLERYVASSNANPPMSRNEVELLCRCTLTASTLAQAFEFDRELYCHALSAPENHSVAQRQQPPGIVGLLRTQRNHGQQLADIAGLFAFKQLFHWLSNGQANCLRVGIGEIPRNDLMPFLLLFHVPVLAEGENST